MSSTITAQDLQNEFDSIAREIIEEVKNYGGDEYELAHQAADGHQWIIYYTGSIDLVHACWHWNSILFDDAQDLAECGEASNQSWLEQTTQLAYCIMLRGITRSLNKINREAA